MKTNLFCWLVALAVLGLAITPRLKAQTEAFRFLLFDQTNTTAYDQLMNEAGSQIASGGLDAAKQTAERVTPFAIVGCANFAATASPQSTLSGTQN